MKDYELRFWVEFKVVRRFFGMFKTEYQKRTLQFRYKDEYGGSFDWQDVPLAGEFKIDQHGNFQSPRKLSAASIKELSNNE